QLAAAAVLLVVMSVTLTLAVTSRSGSETVIVHLYLSAPDAVQVAVVGDWNEWNGDADLLRDSDGDGVWEIRLEVPRGQEYQYQFLIDGRQWIPDPNAAIKVDDGFGGMNSVLDI
ncbi:MAG: isoamylase early set domain-containing protein, partial [Spirochaetota bacterium]|nr:isoamylase early set domain-containing protein [Spirochaetota bacterium]